LANPKAKASDYREHFKLNSREFNFVRQSNPSHREFLIKQSSFSAIGRFDLSGLEEFLPIFAGNIKSLNLFDEIEAQAQQPLTADRWLNLFRERHQEII